MGILTGLGNRLRWVKDDNGAMHLQYRSNRMERTMQPYWHNIPVISISEIDRKRDETPPCIEKGIDDE